MLITADRWIRNLFVEGQHKRAEWVYWVGDKASALEMPSAQMSPYYTADRVSERNVGAFGGMMMPNDFLSDFIPSYKSCLRPRGIIHCCTGNATRALYYIWENIVTQKDGDLRINLLLNHVSKWADVNSHIPYRGEVDVSIKQPLNLSIRIPEWAKPEETICSINDKKHQIVFVDRYAQLGKVAAKDKVKLTFPISERSEWISIEKQNYRVLLRGNTCVAIDPSGKNCPLFQRDHYRENITRWQNRTRFLSNTVVKW